MSKRYLSPPNLFGLGTILLLFLSMNPAVFPQSQEDQAPRAHKQIPDISTPKTEHMVDVGGRQLHCCVYGAGSPAVVLVSGLGAPQEYWNPVIPDLAAETTVLTYDRAGIGRSEIKTLPTHGLKSAEDLHRILHSLGVPGPYLLVGHSYGGSVVRLYASLYPEDMGGLILVDTQHEDVLIELRKILEGEDLESFEQNLIPMFRTPEDLRTESDYREITREQLRSSGPLPRIPFVVLTSPGRAEAMRPLFSDEAIARIAEKDDVLNQRLAALIPGGRHIIVEGAGHNIHVDKPDALILPVLEMIDAVRKEMNILSDTRHPVFHHSWDHYFIFRRP